MFIECKNLNGQQFIQCIEQNAYSANEVIFSSEESFQITPAFFSNLSSIVYSFEVFPGTKGRHHDQTTVELNPNLSYSIGITDPKLQIATLNPFVVSRSVLQLTERAGDINLFLKVTQQAQMCTIDAIECYNAIKA